jgi:hypothetical protein
VSYHLELEIKGLPPMNSARNVHWRVAQREKKLWQELVHLGVVGKKPPAPLPFANIRCTRCSAAMPDADNLAHSFKTLVDALVGVVIEDDSPEHIAISYAWEDAPRNKGSVHIEVWVDAAADPSL